MPSNTYTRIQIHLGQTNTQYILFSLLKRICKKHGVKVDKEFVEVLAFRSALQEVLDQNDTFRSLRQDVLSYLVRSQLVLQESIGTVKSYLRQLIDL
ncbi:uncharacterized protein LOC127150472 isoform X4 [Cucumis melo]|uniref:Uncharacterized protein LOC127150472 isoform X4 n=1 Tax=Cucumis melo TaxID=3656 RepID=A0ABM3L2G7_CUCME|nr:uncharacterized protein LOC127150472 isoform X4 [Cucumis melo]